jgi:CRISPR-associated protein Csd2
MTPYDPSIKHCALWAFDCTMGNPNGDPDRGNISRQDLSTGLGIITDVAIKRKIRNYLEIKGESLSDRERYKILIQEGSVINEQIERAYLDLDYDTKSKKNQTTPEDQQKVLQWMIKNYIDLRFFGGLLSTGNLKAGQYCGPMQITFAQSVNQIFPSEITITRAASTTREENKDNKTMGKKTYIPYGLYLTRIFYSPCKDTYKLVTEKDLHLFWEAVANCFEVNRSASKGLIASQGLWVFSHSSQLGNFPEHKLLDSIQFESTKSIPTRYKDYKIIVDDDIIPAGKVLKTQLV